MSKKQVRSGVFETNSSSVHTITIQKGHPEKGLPSEVEFRFGEYGWEVDRLSTPEEKASYLYTAIATTSDVKGYTNKVKQWLEETGVKPLFDEYKGDSDDWYANGNIDHSYDLAEFIDYVMSSKDNLLSYLFGEGSVYTYNDNMDWDDMRYRKDIKADEEKGFEVIVKGN